MAPTLESVESELEPIRGHRPPPALLWGLCVLAIVIGLIVWGARVDSQPLTPRSYTVSPDGRTLTVYLDVPVDPRLSAKDVHAAVSRQSPQEVVVEGSLDMPHGDRTGPAAALTQAVNVPLTAPLGQAKVLNAQGHPVANRDTRTGIQLR